MGTIGKQMLFGTSTLSYQTNKNSYTNTMYEIRFIGIERIVFIYTRLTNKYN